MVRISLQIIVMKSIMNQLEICQHNELNSLHGEDVTIINDMIVAIEVRTSYILIYISIIVFTAIMITTIIAFS